MATAGIAPSELCLDFGARQTLQVLFLVHLLHERAVLGVLLDRTDFVIDGCPELRQRLLGRRPRRTAGKREQGDDVELDEAAHGPILSPAPARDAFMV